MKPKANQYMNLKKTNIQIVDFISVSNFLKNSIIFLEIIKQNKNAEEVYVKESTCKEWHSILSIA